MRSLLFGLSIGIFSLPLIGAEALAERRDGDTGSRVNMSGTVVSTAADSFYLKYGEGLVLVEMNGWDWYREGRSLIKGEDVIVYGRLDRNLLELETFEASSIFVAGLSTYYYSAPAGGDPDYRAISYSLPVIDRGHQINLTGTVRRIEGREFVLDTGVGEIRVDTAEMFHNPLDDIGYRQIRRGDRVAVAGRLDMDLFENRKILADAIVSLVLDEGRRRAAES